MSMSTKGFTLPEVLLSIAVVGVIAGIGASLYQSLQVRSDMDVAAVALAQSYRRAELLAAASDGDAPWGVNVGSTSITVFKGASYALRDAAYDESFDIPTTISATGILSVVFAKMTGLPQTVGTTTLTSITAETRTVTVGSKGMISY